MKRILLVLACLFSMAYASNLEECYKLYSKDADVLFMNALSAISSNPKLEVKEIQSGNGYILFTYDKIYYLLTVTKRFQNQSEIKIMPQNSDFSQGNEVQRMVFALIDMELRLKPMEIVR